jgi:hypothetical protein
VSRTTLSLFELDRATLQQLSAELKEALSRDDRRALAELLELGGELEARLGEAPRLVDLFVLPETHERAAPLYASLRRVSKKRALTKVLESSEPSLEGRLRGFAPLRGEPEVAASIDKLLNPRRLPWFLRRSGGTAGWIDGSERAILVDGMGRLRGALPPPLRELLDGLEQIDADAVLHDGL